MAHTCFRLAKFMLLCVAYSSCKAAKLRSWLGPDYFFEGNQPFDRMNSGFVSSEDGKIYVFGGFNFDGNPILSIIRPQPRQYVFYN
jgi:hypothetical protein